MTCSTLLAALVLDVSRDFLTYIDAYWWMFSLCLFSSPTSTSILSLPLVGLAMLKHEAQDTWCPRCHCTYCVSNACHYHKMALIPTPVLQTQFQVTIYPYIPYNYCRSINQHNSVFSSKLVSDLLLSFFSAQNGCIHNVTRK